jgi:hypothetical protein
MLPENGNPGPAQRTREAGAVLWQQQNAEDTKRRTETQHAAGGGLRHAAGRRFFDFERRTIRQGWRHRGWVVAATPERLVFQRGPQTLICDATVGALQQIGPLLRDECVSGPPTAVPEPAA